MIRKLILVSCYLLLACSASAFNYAYFSDYEPPAEQSGPFYAGDTLWGRWRSNGCLPCLYGYVFYDLVIMSCTDTCHQAGYRGPDPVYGAPELPFPENADRLRDLLILGRDYHFIRASTDRAVVRFNDNQMRIWWGTQGVPLDTLLIPMEAYTINPNSTIFFECPIRIAGTIGDVGDLVIASSGDIGLDDDLILTCLNQNTHEVPYDCPDRVALVAEGDIVIMNTWANGRNNREQGADVRINAFVVALGESFTFDQQNDEDDTYQGPSPDERGQIYLSGAIAQRSGNRLNNANHGRTGYFTAFRYDYRFILWDIGLFDDEAPLIDPDTLRFGDVAVGTTVWDTIQVNGFDDAIFSGAAATQPFHANAGYHIGPVTIPVSFAPTQARYYSGVVYFYLNGVYRAVPLYGNGVNPPGPLASGLGASPNPFNPITTLRLTLAAPEHVSLSVYNIAGQLVEALANGPLTAGEHRFTFDGSSLASGLYIARLHSPSINKTAKLLLIK